MSWKQFPEGPCRPAHSPPPSAHDSDRAVSFIILVVHRYYGRQADYSTGLLHSSVTNRFFFCLCFKAIAITLALSDTLKSPLFSWPLPTDKQSCRPGWPCLDGGSLWPTCRGAGSGLGNGGESWDEVILWSLPALTYTLGPSKGRR